MEFPQKILKIHNLEVLCGFAVSVHDNSVKYILVRMSLKNILKKTHDYRSGGLLKKVLCFMIFIWIFFSKKILALMFFLSKIDDIFPEGPLKMFRKSSMFLIQDFGSEDRVITIHNFFLWWSLKNGLKSSRVLTMRSSRNLLKKSWYHKSSKYSQFLGFSIRTF